MGMLLGLFGYGFFLCRVRIAVFVFGCRLSRGLIIGVCSIPCVKVLSIYSNKLTVLIKEVFKILKNIVRIALSIFKHKAGVCFRLLRKQLRSALRFLIYLVL